MTDEQTRVDHFHGYIREDIPAAEIARLTARVAELEGQVAELTEDAMWSAYYTGVERDGQWDHCCMSDGEELVRSLGLNPADRVYSADWIKALIPDRARAALTAQEAGE